LERTSSSQISSACSPLSGWLTRRFVDVHADPPGPGGIERVLGVDEGRHAAVFCALAATRQGQRRLTG
jgi:hypothetical protein